MSDDFLAWLHRADKEAGEAHDAAREIQVLLDGGKRAWELEMADYRQGLDPYQQMFPQGAKNVNIQTGPSPKEEWVEFVEERIIDSTQEKIRVTGQAFMIDGVVCAVYHRREPDEFYPQSGLYIVAASPEVVTSQFGPPDRPISLMVHGEDMARERAQEIGRAWAVGARHVYGMWLESHKDAP